LEGVNIEQDELKFEMAPTNCAGWFTVIVVSEISFAVDLPGNVNRRLLIQSNKGMVDASFMTMLVKVLTK